MKTSEAKRLFDILDTYYHFEMIENNMTLENLVKEVKWNPEAVISQLIDIIDNLEDDIHFLEN